MEYYNNWIESEFNGIGVSCDKYFDKMFLQRVFYNQKLYDYEIDYVLKKTFDDLDNVKDFEKFEIVFFCIFRVGEKS